MNIKLKWKKKLTIRRISCIQNYIVRAHLFGSTIYRTQFIAFNVVVKTKERKRNHHRKLCRNCGSRKFAMIRNSRVCASERNWEGRTYYGVHQCCRIISSAVLCASMHRKHFYLVKEKSLWVYEQRRARLQNLMCGFLLYSNRRQKKPHRSNNKMLFDSANSEWIEQSRMVEHQNFRSRQPSIHTSNLAAQRISNVCI